MNEQNKDKKIAFRIKPGTKFEHVTAESRAMAAHREANMRIFRLFVLLFVIVVIVAVMMSVVSYMEECVEKNGVIKHVWRNIRKFWIKWTPKIKIPDI